MEGLHKATRNCRKGEYHKGRHSFDILAGLNPESVEKASFHCKRMFDTLRAKLAVGGGAP